MHNYTVIILGAGTPARGTIPAALISAGNKKRVLDWLLAAFIKVTDKHIFVGGYLLDTIVRAYPHLNYAINPNWQHSSTVGSLLTANIPLDHNIFVTYSDILYRHHTVTQMTTIDADITIAIDSCWQQRYEQRSKLDIQQAETVWLQDNNLTGFARTSTDITTSLTQAEFIGLVKFSQPAIKHILALKTSIGDRIEAWSLPELINHLIAAGLSTAILDVKGDWAELNAAQDLAQFILGTKAETLARLKPMVSTCVIDDHITINVNSWRSNPQQWLDNIQHIFPNYKLAVRSSSTNEDGFKISNAGNFTSILNVNSADQNQIVWSIDQVIASYGNSEHDQQVLVQAMIDNIAISGVAFTRTLSYGAPYYVINYDEITKTSDTVTGGTGEYLQTLILHREQPSIPLSANPLLIPLIKSLQELESLVGYDSLDIEFIINQEGIVHILQIRPITVDHTHWSGTDESVQKTLLAAEKHYSAKVEPSPFLFGCKSLYGIMPDWNPAEIIGTKPRSLALTLYQALITDDVWARQREEFGYRAIKPQSLMVTFAGHPYIDIRASFNSFIPQGIDNQLAEKLVNHYLEYLSAHPHYHDKIEFDVVFTCKAFDFEQQAARLRSHDFSIDEIDALSLALCKITTNAFERVAKDLANIDNLAKRYQQITACALSPIDKALLLINDCKIHGTLPFAHLARSAFIAIALLNSAVSKKAITTTIKNDFLNSIHTIAKQYRNDVNKLRKQQITLENFLSVYGHLRPGTYDITTPAYKDDIDRYIKPLLQENDKSNTEDHKQSFCWGKSSRDKITELLIETGLPDDFHQFEKFIRTAIEGREYGKFIFTRNLSMALDYITIYAKQHNFTCDDVSHLSFATLMEIHTGHTGEDLQDMLHQRIQQAKHTHEVNSGIELPPLITSANDFYNFLYPNNEPNFISHTSIRAPVVYLNHSSADKMSLKGNIVMIPQADPGFDWLFGHEIGGLITAYGGANSHMAIRSAEFGLPAAIGIGKLLYDKLKTAKLIKLDCRSRKIEAVT